MISERSKLRFIRANWIVPIAAAPIQSGEIVIEDGVILEVRQSHSKADDALELGNAVILPGLVNVHTHLDYTVMRGLIEDVEFFPWIRELTARKAAITHDEWEASALVGGAEALAAGVTTIGDCCDSGAVAGAAVKLGLRAIVYQEVFGIDELRSVDAILEELAAKVNNLRDITTGSLVEIGVSPHSPYTVRPALMRALANYARSERLKLCIHASESQAEGALIRSGTGPIADMYVRRGIQWDVPGSGTASYLDRLGILGKNTLLVHGVQLGAEERDVVNRSGAAWAHCPKSNAKLGNGVADISMLGFKSANAEQPGTPVGIGSDSVASNNTIDLFDEMRFAVLLQRAARRKIAAMTARDALEMATIGGARALGLDSLVGSLEVGKRADLCVVNLKELRLAPTYDPVSALVYSASASDVVMTIVDGVDRYIRDDLEPFPGVDIGSANNVMDHAAVRMRTWAPT